MMERSRDTDSAGDLRRGRAPELATVISALPNELFQLRLEDGSECVAHVAGNLRMGFTRLVPGSVVRIERSPLDPTKARICERVARPAR